MRGGWIVTLGLLTIPRVALAIEWEVQAERLQEVSASLLDAAPMPSPLATKPSVRAQTVMSFLPKVNAQVGAKAEDVPSAPVHTVPSLGIEMPFFSSSSVQTQFGINAGYLPSGAEGLVGIKATLKQQAAGATFAISKMGTGLLPYGSLSIHHTEAAMRGPISSKEGEDRFDVRTNIATLSLGSQLTQSYGNYWIGAALAMRRAVSEFYIDEDQTAIELIDDSSKSVSDMQHQAAVGLDLNLGIRVAVGVIDTPHRSRMPRATFAYSRAL